MTFSLPIRSASALILSLPLLAASPAMAAEFPDVVRSILGRQTDGPLAEMAADKRAAMTDCVVTTLDALPAGKKRFIVEGASLDEQEDRFGKTVDENRAEWRKKIAGACAEIAMDDAN